MLHTKEALTARLPVDFPLTAYYTTGHPIMGGWECELPEHHDVAFVTQSVDRKNSYMVCESVIVLKLQV